MLAHVGQVADKGAGANKGWGSLGCDTHPGSGHPLGFWRSDTPKKIWGVKNLQNPSNLTKNWPKNGSEMVKIAQKQRFWLLGQCETPKIFRLRRCWPPAGPPSRDTPLGKLPRHPPWYTPFVGPCKGASKLVVFALDGHSVQSVDEGTMRHSHSENFFTIKWTVV